MKLIHFCLFIALLLLSGPVFAQDAAEQPQTEQPSAPALDNPTSADGGLASSNVQNHDSVENNRTEVAAQEFQFGPGYKFYLGTGPASDLRDYGVGYSARVGVDMHYTYFGIGLEVAWNMIWATKGAKRSDMLDMAYRTTNCGLLLLLNGYIPVNQHVIISLGAGAGLGKKSEIVFSDYDIREDDASWLARVQAGLIWHFDNNIILGADIEFNFGNYLYSSKDSFRWSDTEWDSSMGLVFTLGYLISK
ncbi:MAG: hypothetical protein J6A01_03290 [Proteobacteria bacterium]|nr:hypothetical protein [Pseudomonadota bacterium]